MRLTVVEYFRENESNPYREWFDRLDPQAAAKVATAVLRLEMGNTSKMYPELTVSGKLRCKSTEG